MLLEFGEPHRDECQKLTDSFKDFYSFKEGRVSSWGVPILLSAHQPEMKCGSYQNPLWWVKPVLGLFILFIRYWVPAKYLYREKRKM